MKADDMISQELEIADLKNKVEEGLKREQQLRDTLVEAREFLVNARTELTRRGQDIITVTRRYREAQEDLRAIESVVESIPHWIVRLFWKRKA